MVSTRLGDNARMYEKSCFMMARGQMMWQRKIIDIVTQRERTGSLFRHWSKQIGMWLPQRYNATVVSLPHSAKWASVWAWMARVHHSLHQGWHWAQGWGGYGCGCIVPRCHRSGVFVRCSDACPTACGCLGCLWWWLSSCIPKKGRINTGKHDIHSMHL